MAIEVLTVTQPADPPYLGHLFQDWLADERVGLMKRNPWAKELLQEDLPRVGRHQHTGELTRHEQLLQFLLSQEGYLVYTPRVAQVLYNGYSGHCELNDINQICHDLRNRLHYPELLYRRSGIGMGVGIEDFKPRSFELQVLYPLWGKRGKWIMLDDLGYEVYRDSDSSVFNALGVAVYRLRKILSDGCTRIETRRSSPYQDGAYRLVES